MQNVRKNVTDLEALYDIQSVELMGKMGPNGRPFQIAQRWREKDSKAVTGYGGRFQGPDIFLTMNP